MDGADGNECGSDPTSCWSANAGCFGDAATGMGAEAETGSETGGRTGAEAEAEAGLVAEVEVEVGSEEGLVVEEDSSERRELGADFLEWTRLSGVSISTVTPEVVELRREREVCRPEAATVGATVGSSCVRGFVASEGGCSSLSSLLPMMCYDESGTRSGRVERWYGGDNGENGDDGGDSDGGGDKGSRGFVSSLVDARE